MPEPQMSVFRVLLSAAVRFHRRHRRSLNPFNVAIDWSDESACEYVDSVLGILTNNEHQWMVEIYQRNGTVCLICSLLLHDF